MAFTDLVVTTTLANEYHPTTSGNLAGSARGTLVEPALLERRFHALEHILLHGITAPDGVTALGTASSGIMGITPGTHGTNTPILVSLVGATPTAASSGCRFRMVIPQTHMLGGTTGFGHTYLAMQVTMNAVPSGAATLGAAGYTVDGKGGQGSNIITTVKVDLKALAGTPTKTATYYFPIDMSGITSVTMVDVLLTAAIIDTNTAAIASIGNIRLLHTLA